jgi:signal transduction histidine kinase
MTMSDILTIMLQVFSDFYCFFVSIYCACFKKNTYKNFYILNSIAFLSLAIGDIYYNYNFRILRNDISQSIGCVVTITMFMFQSAQAYCWISLSKYGKYKLFSRQNLPYILFSFILMITLIFYCITGSHPSSMVIWYQSTTLILDMLIWLYAIICLSRALSTSIIFLTLGCLMLISADLTTRCLFMTNMGEVIPSQWVHMVWTAGVVVMAIGFSFHLKNNIILFCPSNSVQVTCCSWLSITSFVVFLTGFVFLDLLNFSRNNFEDFRLILWSLPVTLVFTMISSVLLGNWFSKIILFPINHFLKRIDAFNKSDYEAECNSSPSQITEFKLLGEFIDQSFKKLSTALDNEISIAEQVAHDIRSPLSALEVIIKRLPKIDDNKKNLLRDAITHIRDIVTNLEKKAFPDNSKKKAQPFQVAVLLEQLIDEKKASLQNQKITFKKTYGTEAYSFFTIVAVAPILRRILTNIVNNSCESIEGAGIVEFNLKQRNNDLIITIIDNGSGISNEALQHIFIRGYTTKAYGKGLGLYYAKEHIEQWGGKLTIQSKINHGTRVQIELSLCQPPCWFVSCLLIKSCELIICIDDSISMWHVWNERLGKLGHSEELIYCGSQRDLKRILAEDIQSQATFFVDYEFSGKEYSGLDLIKEILLKRKYNRIFLVTSHYQKENIQNFCVENKIFLIPKAFTPEIPIKIINPERNREVVIMPAVKKSLKILGSLENSIFFERMNDYLANYSVFFNGAKIYIHEKLLTAQVRYDLVKYDIAFIKFDDFDTLVHDLMSEK